MVNCTCQPVDRLRSTFGSDVFVDSCTSLEPVKRKIWILKSCFSGVWEIDPNGAKAFYVHFIVFNCEDNFHICLRTKTYIDIFT